MLKGRELILHGGGEADISHSLVSGLWNLSVLHTHVPSARENGWENIEKKDENCEYWIRSMC